MDVFEEPVTTGFTDSNCTPITFGCVIEHIRHGERYIVAEPGTDGFLASHDGPILIPETAKHQMAFKLTDKRANKSIVVKV